MADMMEDVLEDVLLMVEVERSNSDELEAGRVTITCRNLERRYIVSTSAQDTRIHIDNLYIRAFFN